MRRLLAAILALMLLAACAAPADQEVTGGTATQSVLTEKTEQNQVSESDAELEPDTPSGPNAGTYQVSVDWSQLETVQPKLELVGEKWYDPLPEELILSGAYGALVPYAGQRLDDDWPTRTGCLYGLMTLDGVAVTAPTYSRIVRPGYYSTPEKLPLILLYRGNPEKEQYINGIFAVAGLDGSWCTDFRYLGWTMDGDCLMLYEEEQVTRMSLAGEILGRWTVEELGFSRQQYDVWLGYNAGWICDCRNGVLCVAMDDDGEALSCYDLVTGARSTMTVSEFTDLRKEPQVTEQEPVVPGAERMKDTWLGTAAPGLLQLRELSNEATGGATMTYYREDGTLLPMLTQFAPRWYDRVSVVGGMIEVLDLQTASYYDLETMECVFCTSLNYMPE